MARTTLASRIAEKIHLDYIRGGRTPDGQSLPSVRALREEYGASLATVSQALGLLESRSLVRKGPTGRCIVLDSQDPASTPAFTAPIGLCLPEAFQNVMFAQVHEGVDLECAHTHHHVVVVSGEHYRLSDERAAIERLLAAGCRAVVLMPSFRTEKDADTDYLNSEFQDVPVVLVDMCAPWHRRSKVLFDNRSLGFDLTRYLFGLGHRRVAIETSYGGTLRYVWPTNQDRYQGYLDAHALVGIRPNPEDRWYLDIRDPLEEAFVDENQVEGYLKRWKGDPGRPTAVMALEDASAYAMITMARDMGIDVPRDLTITGFDNLYDHKLVNPYITTLPDFFLAGRKATQRALYELEAGTSERVTYMLPVPIAVFTHDGMTTVDPGRMSAQM